MSPKNHRIVWLVTSGDDACGSWHSTRKGAVGDAARLNAIMGARVWRVVRAAVEVATARVAS